MADAFVQLNTESHMAIARPVGYRICGNGCWDWVGAINSAGYGSYWSEGRVKLAHRVVYERKLGPIPPGLTLDHLCRNRSCVNPDHLEAVTHRTNVLRGSGASAEHARRTHCPRGHALEGDNLVPWERGKRRRCHTCEKIRARVKGRRERAAKGVTPRPYRRIVDA